MALRLSCQLNEAQMCLKQAEWASAAAVCTSVLEREPENVKARSCLTALTLLTSLTLLTPLTLPTLLTLLTLRPGALPSRLSPRQECRLRRGQGGPARRE